MALLLYTWMRVALLVRRYAVMVIPPIGSPCIDSYNWQAKDRTNVINVLYGKTLFALHCLKTNINNAVFYSWCKFILIPKLKKMCDCDGYERR